MEFNEEVNEEFKEKLKAKLSESNIGRTLLNLFSSKGNSDDGRPESKKVKKDQIKLNDKRSGTSSQNSLERERSMWSSLYTERGKLEIEMTSIIGGKTGMYSLYKMVKELDDDAGEKEALREIFYEKQRKLRPLYDRYEAVYEEANKLPPEAGNRFVRSEMDAKYREMLSVKDI